MNCSPLHLAIFRCVDKASMCILRLLVMSGADVNATLDGGYTPLMILSRLPSTELVVEAVRVLIDAVAMKARVLCLLL